MPDPLRRHGARTRSRGSEISAVRDRIPASAGVSHSCSKLTLLDGCRAAQDIGQSDLFPSNCLMRGDAMRLQETRYPRWPGVSYLRIAVGLPSCHGRLSAPVSCSRAGGNMSVLSYEVRDTRMERDGVVAAGVTWSVLFVHFRLSTPSSEASRTVPCCMVSSRLAFPQLERPKKRGRLVVSGSPCRHYRQPHLVH